MSENAQQTRVLPHLARLITLPALAGIKFYQVFVSPMFGQRCRYYPSCSHYALDALRVHGLVKGMCLGVGRILRCNPWSPGGIDHVPVRGKWQGSKEIEISTKGRVSV